MIQATGTITFNDGVTSFVNPLVNVYFTSPQKYSSAVGVAQVGKIVNEGTEQEAFNMVTNIGTYTHEGPNPSFDEVQTTVLAGLQKDYPEVTFKIV